MSSELLIWTNSQTPTLEKRKTAQEGSRKTTGNILRSLPVILTVPPSKSWVFGKNKTVLRALQIFSQNSYVVRCISLRSLVFICDSYSFSEYLFLCFCCMSFFPLFFFLFFPFSSYFLIRLTIFLYFNVSPGLLVCMSCLSYPVRWHGIAFNCLIS